MKKVMYSRHSPGGAEERNFRGRFVQHINAPKKAPDRQQQMRPQQPEKDISSKGGEKYIANFPKIGKVRLLLSVNQTDDFQIAEIVQLIKVYNQFASNRPDAAAGSALPRADRNQIDRYASLASHFILSQKRSDEATI
jgi:hypothetical protein